MAKHASYRGPNRRRHRMFVTKNTEYHFRDGLCIAVRDRRSGHFRLGHLALNRRVAGAVRFTRSGMIVPSAAEPAVGEALYFGGDGRELVTSTLSAIERPTKDLVSTYPA